MLKGCLYKLGALGLFLGAAVVGGYVTNNIMDENRHVDMDKKNAKQHTEVKESEGFVWMKDKPQENTERIYKSIKGNKIRLANNNRDSYADCIVLEKYEIEDDYYIINTAIEGTDFLDIMWFKVRKIGDGLEVSEVYERKPKGEIIDALNYGFFEPDTSSDWTYPDEVDTEHGDYSYNFRDLDQLILACFEAYHNRDIGLMLSTISGGGMASLESQYYMDKKKMSYLEDEFNQEVKKWENSGFSRYRIVSAEKTYPHVQLLEPEIAYNVTVQIESGTQTTTVVLGAIYENRWRFMSGSERDIYRISGRGNFPLI